MPKLCLFNTDTPKLDKRQLEYNSNDTGYLVQSASQTFIQIDQPLLDQCVQKRLKCHTPPNIMRDDFGNYQKHTPEKCCQLNENETVELRGFGMNNDSICYAINNMILAVILIKKK